MRGRFARTVPKGDEPTPFAAIKGDGSRVDCHDTTATNKQIENNSMSNNNNNTANAIANLLWEGSVEIVHKIADLIADLSVECKQDPKKMGIAVGNEWHQIGGEVEGGKPAGLLLAACQEAKMDKKNTYALMNAAQIVTKQRVTQLWQVIVDGDKSKNKGSKDKPSKEGAGQGGLDKSEIPSWDAILKAIKAQPSLTKAQAEEAAALLASKIA